MLAPSNSSCIIIGNWHIWCSVPQMWHQTHVYRHLISKWWCISRKLEPITIFNSHFQHPKLKITVSCLKHFGRWPVLRSLTHSLCCRGYRLGGCGMSGNLKPAGVHHIERVDNLASKAPITRTRTMGRMDILLAMRYNLMRSEMNIETTAQLWLLECAIEYGMSSKDRRWG